MKMFKNVQLETHEFVIADSREDIPDVIDVGYGKTGFWEILSRLGAALDDFVEVPEYELITTDATWLMDLPDGRVCQSAEFWINYFGRGVPFYGGTP